MTNDTTTFRNAFFEYWYGSVVNRTDAHQLERQKVDNDAWTLGLHVRQLMNPAPPYAAYDATHAAICSLVTLWKQDE